MVGSRSLARRNPPRCAASGGCAQREPDKHAGETLGVPFLPARSVEAAVGTASLVPNILKEAQ